MIVMIGNIKACRATACLIPPRLQINRFVLLRRTGGNILLTEDTEAAHGWRAKVADFGMARATDVTSRIKTRTYGTVTHMPPELLRDGAMSKVCSLPWVKL
jgi:hypothetical protein